MESRYCRVRRFLISVLIINFLCLPVLALDNLDTNVDEEIRKNYNPNKLEDDMSLPALPKILRDNTQGNSSNQHASNMFVENQNKNPKIDIQPTKISKNVFANNRQNCAVLKKGTRIKLQLQNNISDKMRKGTKVSFVSLYPVSTTYFSIPMGTVFKGEIINSHKPQFGGNGGLIVLELNSMVINNEIMPIHAHVTKANHKLIFCNNIKGKRKYLSGMLKSTKPGLHFYSKMFRVTENLARDGSSIIVAPFSLAAGVIVLGGNIMASPFLGTFYKGNDISVKNGSEFEVKLVQDVYIYN